MKNRFLKPTFHCKVCSTMIERSEHFGALRRLMARFPVVGLLGARQVGKTTLLAQSLARSTSGPVTRFDLEDPGAVARLVDPMRALGQLKGLVILDEVQHRPELFPSLRVLADRRPIRARFLMLGSASPGLLRKSSKSLAGLQATRGSRSPPLWRRFHPPVAVHRALDMKHEKAICYV